MSGSCLDYVACTKHCLFNNKKNMFLSGRTIISYHLWSLFICQKCNLASTWAFKGNVHGMQMVTINQPNSIMNAFTSYNNWFFTLYSVMVIFNKSTNYLIVDLVNFLRDYDCWKIFSRVVVEAIAMYILKIMKESW